MLTGEFWRQTECCDALEDIVRVSLHKILQKAVWDIQIWEESCHCFLNQQSWPVHLRCYRCPFWWETKEVSSLQSNAKFQFVLFVLPAKWPSVQLLIQTGFNLSQLRSWIFLLVKVLPLVFWQRKFVLHNLMSKEAKKYSSLHFPGGLWDCMCPHSRVVGLGQKSHHGG